MRTGVFYRFFAALKPGSFKECFLCWVSGLKLANNEVIAIDGKTLRHSFDNANNKSAIHKVCAFAAKTGIVLGQEKISDKSNEITAILKLLDLLNLSSAMVTIDAMGTQKKIAQQIIDSGGDYILALKIAMIRHTVLNLLKLANPKFKKDTSIKGLRKMAGWSNATLATILLQ